MSRVHTAPYPPNGLSLGGGHILADIVDEPVAIERDIEHDSPRPGRVLTPVRCILQALAYQGIFVVAWIAIALTHILSGVHERIVGDEAVPAFNAGGLTAWFGAAAIGLALHAMGGVAGSWSAPMTVTAAALIYSLSLRGATRERFVLAG